MREEKVFYDLGKVFLPSDAISKQGKRDCWRAVPYRCGERNGTFLASLGDGRPADVSFCPELTGWYKIYVSVPAYENTELNLKLTKDEGFWKYSPTRTHRMSFVLMEESLWRCCDMTGQSITISKNSMAPGMGRDSMLAWLRFVPMSDAEVEQLLAEQARTDTKRLYATDDIHHGLYEDNITSLSSWSGFVEQYENSDVAWLSLEDISLFTGGKCPGDDPENFGFSRLGDYLVQKQLETFNAQETLTHMVKKGHEMGLKMSISLRMAAWGMNYPFDQSYFDCPFYKENPQYRCVGRDGAVVSSLSYGYEAVQQKVIDQLVLDVSTGCDAITILANRSAPFMLFEKPVADRFFAAYGEYPYELPMDEPRLNSIYCQIMTEFFRKLRKALDEASPDKHIEIHLRTMYSLYDSKYVGLDCELLAKEKLVDLFISYPLRYREILRDSFLCDGKVDLEKYVEHIYSDDPDAFYYQRPVDFDSIEPYANSRGELVGPTDLETNVQQWLDLEKHYGTPVHFEIFPRVVAPETFRKKAERLYKAGAQSLALWDTYGRVPFNALWSVMRKAGHKDAILNPGEPEFRYYRVHEHAGEDMTRILLLWGG